MISNLYSDRNKPKNVEEVIIFDELPKKLRVQFNFILGDILGSSPVGYEYVHEMLCRKYGKLSLSSMYKIGRFDKEALEETLIKNDYDFNMIFDMMELAIMYRVDDLREQYYSNEEISVFLKNIQNDINIYFKESSMGYKMVNGQIIRKDSEITFTEIIEPTINLTYNDLFKNVNGDFVSAIKEYHNGDNKDCLVKALKSLESTMKIICDEKEWQYNETDRCSRLIDICFENGLIPPEMKSEFTSLNSLLKSGILPIRNNRGGHGEGNEEKVVEDYLARYALNITGSCILFLIEASGV